MQNFRLLHFQVWISADRTLQRYYDLTVKPATAPIQLLWQRDLPAVLIQRFIVTFTGKNAYYVKEVSAYERKTNDTAQLSTLLLYEIPCVASLLTVQCSTISPSPAKADYKLRTGRARTSKSYDGNFIKYIDLFSLSTNTRCLRSCKPAFILRSVATQMPPNSSRALQIFETTSTVQLMCFSSSCSITFLPKIRNVSQNSCFSTATGGKLFGALVHHWWLVLLILGIP